jgi:hypothetical protein
MDVARETVYGTCNVFFPNRVQTLFSFEVSGSVAEITFPARRVTIHLATFVLSDYQSAILCGSVAAVINVAAYVRQHPSIKYR